jgi:Fe2+ or Zn2+ uptake regulation protein
MPTIEQETVLQALKQHGGGPLSTNELHTLFDSETVDRSILYSALKKLEADNIVQRKGGVDNNGILGFLWTLNP